MALEEKGLAISNCLRQKGVGEVKWNFTPYWNSLRLQLAWDYGRIAAAKLLKESIGWQAYLLPKPRKEDHIGLKRMPR